MSRQSRPRHIFYTAVVVSIVASFAPFITLSGRPYEEAKEAKIARAMAAGPAAIANHARIADVDENGKAMILRPGTNGWTCMPGHPGMVGHDAMCLDEAALQWGTDLWLHKPKPTNSRPGIVYMLSGGTDWSATDPWALSGTPIKEPPHWAVVWPFDPKETGLPDQPKRTGAWIMFAGTPYAHVMINQKP
jgi:hypothetical protein